MMKSVRKAFGNFRCLGFQFDVSLVSELDSVTDQVNDDLLDSVAIRTDHILAYLIVEHQINSLTFSLKA